MAHPQSPEIRPQEYESPGKGSTGIDEEPKKEVDDLRNLHEDSVDKFMDVHSMSLPPPSSFHASLSSDRLQIIANWLLEEFYSTQDDLSRDTDSGYGRGCATFDRQRNRIIQEALSGNTPWLAIKTPTFDLVFTIGDVPCRFSNDSPSNPTKNAVLAANRYQIPFADFVEEGEPGRFCFVIDRGLDGLADPHVELLGYSASGELVCHWIADTARVLYAESVLVAPTVHVEKPSIVPRDAPTEVGHVDDAVEQDPDATDNSSPVP